MKKHISIVFLFLAILTSCEYEKIPAPKKPHKAVKSDVLQSVFTDTKVSINATIWTNVDYLVVPLSNLSINNLDTTNGNSNNTGTLSGMNSFNNGDSIKLYIKSVYTKEYLYILAEWLDATTNASGNVLFWNDESLKWKTKNNDDKLIINFHYPQVQTYLKDVWTWSLAKSEPLGYAIDGVVGTNNQLINDSGNPMFAKNENTSGTPIFEYNGESQSIIKADSSKALIDPNYFLYKKTTFVGNVTSGKSLYHACAECHEPNDAGYNAPDLKLPWFIARSRAATKDYILNDPKHFDGATHIDHLSDSEIDDIFAWIRSQIGISKYYLQTPSGSIADVFSSSNVSLGKINIDNKTGYKVLLKRKLITGNPDDIAFDTSEGNTYTIDISLCNNDSVNFVGAVNQKLIFKKTSDEK